MFKNALLALTILGGIGVLAAPALADSNDGYQPPPYAGRDWNNPNDSQAGRHGWQDGDDWRRDRDDDDWWRDRDDDDDRYDWRRRQWNDQQWSNPWWRPDNRHGWYDNDRRRCAAWHGRNWSHHDLARYLRGYGVRDIRDIDRRRDYYRVKGIDRHGRRVTLFVDRDCGRVRYWQ